MKLNIEQAKIDQARSYARKIVDSFDDILQGHSSVTIERTVARLLGIDGALPDGETLPNVLVDHLRVNGVLDRGVAYWIANGMLTQNMTAQQVAEAVAQGKLDLTSIPSVSPDEIFALLDELSAKMLSRIKEQRVLREEALQKNPRRTPAIYVIVATGNIFEDTVQAKAAVRQGADIIAVIRSTAQSLLDYVPYGATTEGFGGTFATQENFRIMRKGLDEVGEEVGKYIFLTNYASGLCMPEIAAMGAIERLDIMLNDAMYGILFRDINMKRTFLDQYFSRMINAYAGIEIQTGEDNYLTTSDAIAEAYTVTASQFINEQFAVYSGIKEEKMGLGHAFEINPEIENSVLYEMSHAMLTKTLFPNAPVKYMPPTKFASGNVYKTYLLNGMFNFVAQATGQGVQLLGMMTEAVHTPHLIDRALAIENAEYVFKAVKNFGDEFEVKKDGFIDQRAKQVLEEATSFLEYVESVGLMNAMAEGKFAGIKRNENEGKGLDGVFRKDENYINPFIDKMKEELKLL
jgi:beta-lysine 5,6-aminomutase alpha subunit